MWAAIINATDSMLGRGHDIGMADMQRRWANKAADTQFARQKGLQQMQMNWQEQMANTAYQRAADDLEKAGLNRILALGTPSATPSGGIGSAQGASIAAGGRSATHSTVDAIAKGEAAKLSKQNQKLVDEQILTQIEQQNLMAAQSAKALAEARESELRGDRLNVMNPVYEQIGAGTKEASNFISPMIKDASDFWNDSNKVEEFGNSIKSRFISGAKGIGAAASEYSQIPSKAVKQVLEKIKPQKSQKSKSRENPVSVFRNYFNKNTPN